MIQILNETISKHKEHESPENIDHGKNYNHKQITLKHFKLTKISL